MINHDSIETWLLWVGVEYGVREAHRYFRSKRKPPADHCVYYSITSTPTGEHAVKTTSDTKNDTAITYNKKFRTVVKVDCYDENGMLILQSLDASTSDPRVREIFGNSVSCLGQFDSIVDVTEYDETHNEPAKNAHYTAQFQFIEMVSFTKTRTNHVFDDFELTGTVVDDNDDEYEITITGP